MLFKSHVVFFRQFNTHTHTNSHPPPSPSRTFLLSRPILSLSQYIIICFSYFNKTCYRYLTLLLKYFQYNPAKILSAELKLREKKSFKKYALEFKQSRLMYYKDAKVGTVYLQFTGDTGEEGFETSRK